MGHTSTGRGINGTDLVVCVTSLDIPRASRSNSFNPLCRGRFIAWHSRRPFLRECRRGSRHFMSRRTRLGYGPAPGPTLKKALCLTRLFGGIEYKYRWSTDGTLTSTTTPVLVDLGVIAIKWYSTFAKAPKLVPLHHMILCHI